MDLSSLLNDPGFVTGLGMLGSTQTPGAAFMQAAQQSRAMALQQQQLQAAQLANQMAQKRASFNPADYMISNRQPVPAAGPATTAALAATMGGAAANTIGGNAGATNQSMQAMQPPGAIGNVDYGGLLQAGMQAGMTPEEMQGAASMMDPRTALLMRLAGQPAMAAAPGAAIVQPGMQYANAVMNPGQPPAQTGQGGPAGVLFQNNNPPADSPVAQLQQLQAARSRVPDGSPGAAQLDALIAKQTGGFEQGNPEDIQSMADAIGHYQMAPPNGMAMRSPLSQKVMAAVVQKYPNYDAKNWGMQDAAVKDFATGTQGNQVRSLNVAVNHLDTLGGLVSALKNGDVNALNKAANEYKAQTGSAAPTNFDAAKQIVGDEIVKAIIGSGGASGDRDAAQAAISSARSPEQLSGVINTYQHLLGGQLNGLQNQYKGSTGRSDFSDRFLTGRTREVLGTGQAAPQQKTVARTGTFNGRKVVQYSDGTTEYAN